MMLGTAWQTKTISDKGGSEIRDTETWSKTHRGRQRSLVVPLTADTELPELPAAALPEVPFTRAFLTSPSSSLSQFYSPTKGWIHVSSWRQRHSYCKARLLTCCKRLMGTSNWGWKRQLSSTIMIMVDRGISGVGTNSTASSQISPACSPSRLTWILPQEIRASERASVWRCSDCTVRTYMWVKPTPTNPTQAISPTPSFLVFGQHFGTVCIPNLHRSIVRKNGKTSNTQGGMQNSPRNRLKGHQEV